MSLKAQISRLMRQKMGVYADLPRFQRVPDNTMVYGYLARGQMVSNPWLAENVMTGAVSADSVIKEGELYLDRALGKHFFVTGLTESQVAGETVRYDFQAYLCNEVLTWQRLTEGPRDSFTHKPSPSSYQTINPAVYALLSIDRFFTDKTAYSEEDTSNYFIFHNYAAAREGDKVITSRGKELIVKINDLATFSAALIKSMCVGGAGG